MVRGSAAVTEVLGTNSRTDTVVLVLTHLGSFRAKWKMFPPAKRRKPLRSTTEEITFDDHARQDYLTGFHRRKLQRTKLALEAAAKKEWADKLEERRKVSAGCKQCHHDPQSKLTRRYATVETRTEGRG